MDRKIVKYRINIDEVGNSDLQSSVNPNHRYLNLTGVIFDLDFVNKILHKDIEAIKEKYFSSHPDEPVILHRKDIINHKYPFHSLRNPEIESAFSRDILDCFTRWDFSIISILIDKKEHQERYTIWKYDPYHYCMEIIVERYYRFLRDRNAVGDLMFESRGGKEDRRLKNSYKGIFEKGTNYIKSEELKKTLTSCELKIKPKSANVSGLQVADLLAFPSRKFIFDYYKIQPSEKITFNDNIINVIKDKYYKRGNRIEGYGIKLLP